MPNKTGIPWLSKSPQAQNSVLGVSHFLQPSLTPIIRNRNHCLVISGVAATHAALTFWGLPSWQCPVRHALGIPCPGCGLSRAVLLMTQGQWSEAVEMHAYAPLLVLGLVVITLAGLLPNSSRLQLVSWIELFEKRTYLVSLALIGLVLYWGVRMTFFTDELYQLVM